mmetsp:Transcript_12550/g.20883  ORF Transcript_12550/g.20883 Transcript_12550/m.20883 type:complete len:368 (-) Transcript_12550:138-1241(-)|eukprot:CAMPEP_0197717620 /NCGR_PEP_ID=MMETSP1434-20131217/2099_1 /TAXON_ID=265543 /ORGANISM="Minutocellus polymorphus, Strain CCMP3303" /LENGTH=367 /DNA_ID=CAMNT_0043302177 /DNA_START=223 /DNA_END=1326 /DNA_ORIENTATION=+
MPTSGVKRSAVGDGSGEIGGAIESERPAEKDRSPKSAGGPPGKAPSTPTDSRSEIGANIDLIGKISLSMNSGDGLYELCVAVGPKFAARIRHDYLLKNEKYLVKSLETLHRSLPTDTRDLRLLCHYRPQFNKCRDNIRAWMKVNTAWRSRCTESNLAKYKGFTSKQTEPEIEANLIFNHPALIVELGLIEIFRHLVEGLNINLTKKIWKGFCNGFLGSLRGSLAELAYNRSDVILLKYLLSAPSFDWKEDTKLGYVLYEAIINDSVTIDCFKSLFGHPRVNLNAPEAFGAGLPPLHSAVMFASNCGSVERLSKSAERVITLLELGADPRVSYPDFPNPRSALDIARAQLHYSHWPEFWKEIVHKMEE